MRVDLALNGDHPGEGVRLSFFAVQDPGRPGIISGSYYPGPVCLMTKIALIRFQNIHGRF